MGDVLMKFNKLSVKCDDVGYHFWILRSRVYLNTLSYSFYRIGAIDYAGQIRWGYIDFKYQIVPICMIWLWNSESSTSYMSQELRLTLDLICNIAIGIFVRRIVFVQYFLAKQIFLAISTIFLYIIVLVLFLLA